MPERKKKRPAPFLRRALLSAVIARAVFSVWYFMVYGMPLGRDIKDGGYVRVTLTRLDTGEVLELDESSDSPSDAFKRFDRAANMIHMVRVTPLRAKRVSGPYLKFEFEKKDGTVRVFIVGDGTASSGDRVYRMHHWSDRDLFDNIVRYVYFGDGSVDIDRLAEHDD